MRVANALTEDTLIAEHIEVDDSYRGPDPQQGQNNEPREEAAAAAARPGVHLLPVLVG